MRPRAGCGWLGGVKIKFADNRPPGSWKCLEPLDVSVAGVQYRHADTETFVRGADHAAAHGWLSGVTLRWERENRHDPNAIAIHGFWIVQRQRWFRKPVKERRTAHIGYVPAEIAAKVAPRIDAGETIVADLRRWYQREGSFSDLNIGLYWPK